MNFDAISKVIPCKKSEKSSNNTLCKRKKKRQQKHYETHRTNLKKSFYSLKTARRKSVFKVSTLTENTNQTKAE